MASLIHKLVRNQPLSRTLIADLNTRILSSPTRLLDPKPDPPVDPIPFFNNIPKRIVDSNPNPLSSAVYPSFAFQELIFPVAQTGDFRSVLPEEDGGYGDEERGIWADSVKKKRKKKMNKHKLKKLRKRLRRKT